MRRFGPLAIGLVAIAVFFILISSVFTVQQGEQAVVVQFGFPLRDISEPGLRFKLPLVQNVIYFDKRVLDYDSEDQEVPTLDQKQLVVDTFARYRIVNPLLFYQTVGNERGVEARLSTIMNSAMRSVLGDVPLSTVLTPERSSLMRKLTDIANNEAKGFGILVLDVRIKRVDLPEENMQAIIRRMQTQRGQEARKIRAEGDKEARRIHADADMQQRVILAEARNTAEVTRGQGDGEAQRLYNDTFGKDPQFFDFWRSMMAMQRALPKESTTFIGSPDGDFFRYFYSQQGAAPVLGGAGAAAPAKP
jgi:membrane protease subunit HflC